MQATSSVQSENDTTELKATAPTSITMSYVRLGLLIVFSLLLARIISVRLHFIFFDVGYPPSTDGFFYLKEIKSWAERGQGYYTSYSLFFALLGAFSYLFHVPTLLAFNVAVVASLLVFSLALVTFLYRRTPLWVCAGALHSFWASEILFYRHYAFLKQGMAISCFALALAVLNRILEVKRGRRGTLVFAYALLAFASLTHIYCAILSAGILLVRIARDPRYRTISVFFLCLIIVSIGLYLSFHPKELFAEHFQLWPPAWVSACSFAQCSPFEYREFIIYSLLYVAWVSNAVYQSSARLEFLFLAGVVFLQQMPLWTEVGLMSQRLAFSSAWLIFILGAMLLGQERKSPSGGFDRSLLLIPWAGLTLLATSNVRSYKAPEMVLNALEQHATVLKKWISEDAFVIADHGAEFQISYFLDRSSASKTPVDSKYINIFELRTHSDIRRRCFELLLSSPEVPADASCVHMQPNLIIQKLKG